MIERIDHVGIAVRSIEEARRLYEALGLGVETIEEVPEEGVRVALIPCGESRIELLEATAEDSPIHRFLEQRGPGMHHLCLVTDDVRAEGQRLRDSGFQVIREDATRGGANCWVQFVHPASTGGVLIELSEHGEEETEADR